MSKIKVKCPECQEKVLVNDLSDKCPVCGWSQEFDDAIVCLPSLRSAKTDRIDGSYRELEASSQARAEQAAEAAGCSVADMSELKVTNLKTGVKPGESYVPEVRNAVTEQMDIMKARGGQVGFTGADAVHLASQVKAGPYPNAGANMLSRIQRMNGR